MTRDKFSAALAKKRRSIEEKLARDVLCRRRDHRERWIIFVQEFVIETVAQDLAHPLFDLADVHQHPGRRIDAP